jgi:hypothetical protein
VYRARVALIIVFPFADCQLWDTFGGGKISFCQERGKICFIFSVYTQRRGPACAGPLHCLGCEPVTIIVVGTILPLATVSPFITVLETIRLKRRCIPDTFDGARQIRELRDKAKDEL